MSNTANNIGDVNAKLGIDISAFDAGLKQATASVEPTARAIEKAAKKSAEAQAVAAKYAADTVTAEGRRILESRNLQAQSVRDLSILQNAMKFSYLSESEGSAAAAAALQRLTASRLQDAVAAKLQAEAGHTAVISQQMAASGTIRLAEGNNSIRAVERFITTIPGVGAALQKIFPIIGATAFAGIIVDIGEKIYETEQKAAHAGDLIARVFQESHDKARINIDDLSITNDKLQDEIDKLSGHPNNGVATALDEARKMADQLVISLQAGNKELEGLLKEHEVGTIGSLLSGVSGTKVQGKEMLQDQRDLTDAVRKANEQLDAVQAATTDAKKIKEATEIRNAAVQAAFQSQIDVYQREGARLRKEQADSENSALQDTQNSNPTVVDNSAKIANNQGRVQQLMDELAKEKLAESIFARTATVGGMKQDKGEGNNAAEAQRKAAEAQMKTFEAGMAARKSDHDVSIQEEYEYWAKMESAAAKYPDNLLKVQEKVGQIYQEWGKQGMAEAARMIEQQKRMAEAVKGDNERFAALVKAVNEQASRAGDAQAKATEAIAKSAAAMAELMTAHEVSTGAITKYDAALRIAGLHAEVYAAQLKKLKQQQADLDGNTSLTVEERSAKQSSIDEQHTNIQGEADRQSMQDQWNEFSQTALGGAITALQEFTASSLDSAAMMKQIVSSTLSSTNSTLVKMLTEKNYQRRGQFSQLGSGIFKDVSGAALKKGEGSIMGMIPGLKGLGGGKLGTKGNPMIVAFADSAMKAGASLPSLPSLPSVFGGAAAKLPNFNLMGPQVSPAVMSSITAGMGGPSPQALGQSIFGTNGPAMPEVSPEDGISSHMAAQSGIGNLVQSLTGTAFKFAIPFLDSGTNYVPNDMVAQLHEGEGVVPKKYNHPGGGDTHHTWNIDARGSTDPAQTAALVQQGIMQAAPHIVAASLKAHNDQNSRLPPAQRK